MSTVLEQHEKWILASTFNISYAQAQLVPSEQTLKSFHKVFLHSTKKKAVWKCRFLRDKMLSPRDR